MLCDTCPRAYHLVCLDPELEEAPEGTWSCPHCEKEGVIFKNVRGCDYIGSGSSMKLDKNGKSALLMVSENDEHQEFCTECRDGGDLICCENCPASYHMGCLIPPLTSIPEGVWLCPNCGGKPMKARVSRLLTWRWFEPPKNNDEMVHTHYRLHEACDTVLNENVEVKTSPVKESASKDEIQETNLVEADKDLTTVSENLNNIVQQVEGNEVPKSEDVDPSQSKKSDIIRHTFVQNSNPKPHIIRRPTREFFVKYVDMSYWHCEWLSELQLYAHHPIMLRNYFKKNDMEEPPLPEDGSTYR